MTIHGAARKTSNPLIAERLVQETVAAAFLRSAATNEQRLAWREVGSSNSLTDEQWRSRARAMAGSRTQS